MPENKTIEKKVKSISLRFLIEASLFLLAVFVFGWLANEIVIEKENYLDNWAFSKLQSYINPSATRLMLVITFFGSVYFLSTAYLFLIVYYLFFKKKRKLSLDVASIGITSTIILFTLKTIFHRARPLDPVVHPVSGFSFPSGHSFSSFTFFGLLIYILWNQQMNSLLRWVITILLFLFACIIAISRVYLHVHYASDVLAGFCLCIVWLVISLWLLKKFDKKLS